MGLGKSNSCLIDKKRYVLRQNKNLTGSGFKGNSTRISRLNSIADACAN